MGRIAPLIHELDAPLHQIVLCILNLPGFLKFLLGRRDLELLVRDQLSQPVDLVIYIIQIRIELLYIVFKIVLGCLKTGKKRFYVSEIALQSFLLFLCCLLGFLILFYLVVCKRCTMHK